MFLALIIVGILQFTQPVSIATLKQPVVEPVATFQVPVKGAPVCLQACNSPQLQAANGSALILQ